MNILLLNPPGNKLYVRDYYCSKISKANYIYHPVDLLMLSGILGSRYKIDVIDAIVDKLSTEQCLSKIVSKRPDAIIALTGSVSVKEDISFFSKIKRRISCPIYVSGDIMMEKGKSYLSNADCIDGIILDFTSFDILTLLDGTDRPLDTIMYKSNNKIVRETGKSRKGEIDIPPPEHKLFINRKYSYPFISSRFFATVLTDYGCPYKCSFCIMGSLPYKYRKMSSIAKELESLHQLKVKEIYFSDQTFGAIKNRGIELCNLMIERGFNFGWVCFSRADITDKAMLRTMKDAGCHTVIYGVESGNEKLLKKYNKNITKDMLRKAFSTCKDYGIKTVGTFVIGLPEDDERSIFETIAFAKELECDYASINIYVPRMHTRLREEILKDELASESIEIMDQSGSYSVMGTKYLMKSEVLKLKNIAVKKFYLRPQYILRRLFNIKSVPDLKREVKAGLGILADIFKGYLK